MIINYYYIHTQHTMKVWEGKIIISITSKKCYNILTSKSDSLFLLIWLDHAAITIIILVIFTCSCWLLYNESQSVSLKNVDS